MEKVVVIESLCDTGSFEYELDLSRCVVIRDRWTDLVAANKVGAIKILVYEL